MFIAEKYINDLGREYQFVRLSLTIEEGNFQTEQELLNALPIDINSIVFSVNEDVLVCPLNNVIKRRVIITYVDFKVDIEYPLPFITNLDLTGLKNDPDVEDVEIIGERINDYGMNLIL